MRPNPIVITFHPLHSKFLTLQILEAMANVELVDEDLEPVASTTTTALLSCCDILPIELKASQFLFSLRVRHSGVLD
jgi:hypothetical protein